MAESIAVGYRQIGFLNAYHKFIVKHLEDI